LLIKVNTTKKEINKEFPTTTTKRIKVKTILFNAGVTVISRRSKYGQNFTMFGTDPDRNRALEETTRS
jgi:hypothetical protein